MIECPSCGWCREGALEGSCPRCNVAIGKIDGIVVIQPAVRSKAAGFIEEHYTRLAPNEKGHFWFESRNALIIWAIRKLLPGAQTMLEVGCGTGFVTQAIEQNFSSLRLTAVDNLGAGLRYAAKRLRRTTVCKMDASKIPFVEEFDVVGAFDVIEHIEDDERALVQFRKAIRPGGSLVLTVPQHQFLWTAADECACHQRRYSRSELMEKLRRNGFQVRCITSFVSLLFPVLVLARLRGSRHGRYDPDNELNLSRGINRALGMVMQFERWLIRGGIRFPFGGSLLVIAAKQEGLKEKECVHE